MRPYPEAKYRGDGGQHFDRMLTYRVGVVENQVLVFAQMSMDDKFFLICQSVCLSFLNGKNESPAHYVRLLLDLFTAYNLEGPLVQQTANFLGLR